MNVLYKDKQEVLGLSRILELTEKTDAPLNSILTQNKMKVLKMIESRW